MEKLDLIKPHYSNGRILNLGLEEEVLYDVQTIKKNGVWDWIEAEVVEDSW